MLGRIVGFFFPKVGELLVDYVHENIKDFKLTLETLERNLKSLIAKASDVEEQIKKAELSGKRKRKREVDNWLKDVKAIEIEFLKLENESESEGFISKFMGGGRAAELNGRVDVLVEQSRHFGELLVDLYETRGEALLTTRLVGKAFEENLERIWRLLVDDEVRSIGIYGMGGAGKTTLAKHINNRLLEKTQECVFWITISQVFTIDKLQDEIANVLHVDFSGEDNEDKKAARLHRALSVRRKIILILDDVWNNINLEKVGNPLFVEGCRLVITTRSLEVCRQIGCQKVIAVKTLDMDEAWNLFSETLGKQTKLAQQVEEIAKCIAKMCDGLPLGIITLAGSMRGETAICVWRTALEELKESTMGQDAMEDQVFKVLKYSFDRLNPKHQRRRQFNGYNALQLCFLYCSLYPEDCKVSKKELVGKFISEELMNKRKSRKKKVDEAYSILGKLLNVCLLESTIGYDGCDSVKMHDLVRAMALKINEGKTIVRAGQSLKEVPQEEEWTKDLEKISLMENGIMEIAPGMSPNCPKLATLLLPRNPLKFLPDSFFSRMHGLCTLDLSGTDIKELPNSLSDLESLRVLLLGKCKKLEDVPYLGRLTALRELDLSYTAIKVVPQGIEELVNLKFLSVNNARKLEMFPIGLLLKFPHLQHLRFPQHIEMPVQEVKSLKQLEEFSGRMKNVCDFNQFIGCGQNRVYDTFYVIQVGSASSKISNDYRLIHWKEVTLYQYNLKKGKEKDETMLGHDIQHLKLDECEGLSNCLLNDFPHLINPIFLKSLKIFSCGGIECILRSEQLIAAEEIPSQFETLELIALRELRDFKGVTLKREIGDTVVASPPPRQAVFSSLRSLFIANCHKMKQLGLPVVEFPNLEQITILECDEIEEIIQISDNYDGRGEGEARLVSLPKLRELELRRLPRLRSICKATMISTSIQIIYLWKCPTLKKLPLDVVPPPALKHIFIRQKEWESLEWENPTHSHLLQPFLRFWP